MTKPASSEVSVPWTLTITDLRSPFLTKWTHSEEYFDVSGCCGQNIKAIGTMVLSHNIVLMDKLWKDYLQCLSDRIMIVVDLGRQEQAQAMCFSTRIVLQNVSTFPMSVVAFATTTSTCGEMFQNLAQI